MFNKCVVENFCKIEDIKTLDYNALNLALKITNFIDDWDYFTKKMRLSKKVIEKILNNKLRTSKGNLYFLINVLLTEVPEWQGDENIDPEIKLGKLRGVYNSIKDDKFEELNEYEILDYIMFKI